MQRLTADELEKLFLRLDPNSPQEWKSASAAQIDAIERIAGRPVPKFYSWFLDRMGEDMGSMSYGLVDFSARRVLSVYHEGELSPDGRRLLIGYNLDEVMPVHFFYDLDRPARDDCMVVQTEIDDFCPRPTAETFREMLGWAKFTNRRVRKLPQVCEGSVSGPEGMVRPKVDAAMTDLGFSNLLRSGPFCGLYDRDDAAASFSGRPDLPPKSLSFRLGGSDVGSLRRILGSLASSDLEVEVGEWEPALDRST